MGFDMNVPIADGIAVLVSVVAVAISIIAMKQTRKINNTNLQSIYYEYVFKKYLLKRIPKALHKIQIRDNKLCKSYRYMTKMLMDMLEDAKYFEYIKPDFYNQLKSIAVEIDDELVSSASKTFYDEDIFRDEIKKKTVKMVRLINDNYCD